MESENIVYSTALAGEMNSSESKQSREEKYGDDWQFTDPITADDEYEMDEEFARSMEEDEGLFQDSMLASLAV